MLTEHERRPWPILFSMQHHGAATRLLDWTESFACALFFALEEPPIRDATPCVWVLNPEQWNQGVLGISGIVKVPEDFEDGRIPVRFYHPNILREAGKGVLGSIAVTPPHTNVRLQAQQGRFTLMDDRFIPMERQTEAKEVLVKIDITEVMRTDAEAFVALSGYRFSSVFPDLTGIVRQMDSEQQFKLRYLRNHRSTAGL